MKIKNSYFSPFPHSSRKFSTNFSIYSFRIWMVKVQRQKVHLVLVSVFGKHSASYGKRNERKDWHSPVPLLFGPEKTFITLWVPLCSIIFGFLNLKLENLLQFLMDQRPENVLFLISFRIYAKFYFCLLGLKAKKRSKGVFIQGKNDYEFSASAFGSTFEVEQMFGTWEMPSTNFCKWYIHN